MNNEWISATEIEQTHYCANSFYLRNIGKRMTTKALKTLKNGSLRHEHISRLIMHQDSRCYVATELFGNEHVITQDLRNWRDHVLNIYGAGAVVRKIYYAISPCIASLTRKNNMLRKLAQYGIIFLYKKVIL